MIDNTDQAEQELSPKIFLRYCDLIYDVAGIKLGAQKESLLKARVSKRMRTLGMNCFEEYLSHIENDTSGTEIVELLNAISTNVTYFFRERAHFDVLGETLTKLYNAGQTSIRIWSAACSSGEEPYTMAIMVRESLPESADVKILATDISTKVLQRAKSGIFDYKSMEKMPDKYMSKYFTRITEADAVKYQASDSLRKLITFSRINLAKPPFAMRGPFDVVFCRNVMIYFDNEVRRGLLSEIERLLNPKGLLMVGHAESLSGMLSNMKSIRPSIYVK